MSNQQHTKGQWSINEWKQPDNSIAIGAVGTPLIARVILRDVSINEQKANARRIVACVNACEGMDDAEISRGLISTNHYSTVVNERDSLKEINAELLDAAQEMAYLLENILRVGALKSNDLIIAESIRNVLPIHRAAIAKATGS